MAERACSPLAWGGRAQSAVREMNDSRYYQPLLLAGAINDACATALLYSCVPTRPARPLYTITTSSSSASDTTAASPTTPGQRRERESASECAHVRATADAILLLTPKNTSHSRRGSALNCAFLHVLTTAAEGVVRDWSRCCPHVVLGRSILDSTLPANQPADRE